MWYRSAGFGYFAVGLALLGASHAAAVAFSLYWTYPWFDIPMHALGGAVVALGFLVAHVALRHGAGDWGFWTTLAFVLVVGTLWELFEFWGGINGPQEPDYIADTILDFAMDLLGGAVGYFIYAKTRANA